MEIEVACFSADAYDERTFLHWFRDGPDLFLLGERGGPIVAYIIARLEGPQAAIVSLGVDPLLRRRGVGRRLVNEILRRLGSMGAATVDLESRFDNLKAIHFWRAQGFTPVGVVPGYYEDGVSALKLRLRLEPGGCPPPQPFRAS